MPVPSPAPTLRSTTSAQLAPINGVSYFDFGLPFFYNRTVFTIIEGSTVGTTMYSQGAFAY